MQRRCKRIHAFVISHLSLPAAWWHEELQLKQATCFICWTTASLTVSVCQQIWDDRTDPKSNTYGMWGFSDSSEAQYITAHCFSCHRPPFHLVFDILHTHTLKISPGKKRNDSLIKVWYLDIYSHFVRVVTYQVCLVSWHFCTLKWYWPHDGSWTKIWMYTPRC